MMTSMVLASPAASVLRRYVEYFIAWAWALLAVADTGSMPESSKKLYVSYIQVCVIREGESYYYESYI